jgi:hypothetical protein
MKPIATFRTGRAMTSDFVCVSAAMDLLPPQERYTRVVTYDEAADHLWSFHEEEDIVVAIAILTASSSGLRCFVTLSQDGEVAFMDDEYPESEQVLGAGLWNSSARGWGYMSCLKQIGQHLYAAGGAGQVYRRLGPDQWVHMDDGLLQAPDVSERLLPRAIDGPHESAIYLLGSVSAAGLPPFLCFWNGQHWTRLPLPEVAERLTGIHVESESRIWLCGANGTLLLGNDADGFKSLSTVDDNQLFLSVTLFQGRAYLGSNLGLFVYDPAQPSSGIQPVITGLTPELQDAHQLRAKDGVLWSFGFKDLACFDGKQWTRIDHPDNPRIGGTTP